MIDFKQTTLILLFITAIPIFAIFYMISAKVGSKIIRCLLLCVGTVSVSFGITVLLSNMMTAAIPVTDVKVIKYNDKDINKYIYDVNEMYENKDIPDGLILLTTKEWLFIKNVTAEVNSLAK